MITSGGMIRLLQLSKESPERLVLKPANEIGSTSNGVRARLKNVKEGKFVIVPSICSSGFPARDRYRRDGSNSAEMVTQSSAVITLSSMARYCRR